ncbi:rRNA maturation RNase YbeY [Eubacteriales bacterium KG127]
MIISGDFTKDDLWNPKAEELMDEICIFACQQEGIPEDRVEISLSFVDEDDIRRLNREYRGIDKSTDVLSFPQFDTDEEVPEYGPIFLGDVVICSPVCRRQAAEFGHSEDREFTYLFVHSLLHLLGYDHINEEERKHMRIKEKEIIARVLGGIKYEK